MGLHESFCNNEKHLFVKDDNHLLRFEIFIYYGICKDCERMKIVNILSK